MEASDILRQKIAELKATHRDSLKEDFDLASSIGEALDLVETEIGLILQTMATCRNVDEAAPYLDKLGQIQGLLATLRFKYRVPLTAMFHRVVEELDRMDDQELRSRIFARIRSGEPL